MLSFPSHRHRHTHTRKHILLARVYFLVSVNGEHNSQQLLFSLFLHSGCVVWMEMCWYELKSLSIKCMGVCVYQCRVILCIVSPVLSWALITQHNISSGLFSLHFFLFLYIFILLLLLLFCFNAVVCCALRISEYSCTDCCCCCSCCSCCCCICCGWCLVWGFLLPSKSYFCWFCCVFLWFHITKI